MGEIQEKVWVVSRYEVTVSEGVTALGDKVPVKVFDDRLDARDYCTVMRKRAKKYGYALHGVKKG